MSRATHLELHDALAQLHQWFVTNKGKPPEAMRITAAQQRALEKLTDGNKPLPTDIRFNGRADGRTAYTYKDVPLKVV